MLPKKTKSIKRFLVIFLKIIVILFVTLSLLPYLIPLKELSFNRHDLAYPESSFSIVEGIEMHYRVWGNNREPRGNILLVHGFGASTFSWRYTAPVLQEKGYRVVALDLPGFGFTERKIGFNHSSEARASVIWQLLEMIDEGSGWHLVGHSMGGATVTAMALQKPDQVESMVLAAGALSTAGRSRINWLFRYPPLGRWLRVLSTRVLFTENNVERMLASAYGRSLTADEVEGYFQPIAIKDSDLILIELIKSSENPLMDRVADLKMPVLLIWGENDSWVTLKQGQNLLARIPYAELIVLPGEGHCPMETAPDLFNAELLNFLDGLAQ